MIETEIHEVVANAANAGVRLNEIADQFRRGRDVNELTALLDSSDIELLSIGAWILGELHFELYNFDRFISRLRELLDHKDPTVRFHALGAIYPALNPLDATRQALLRKLPQDPNAGVRKRAEAAAARLSST
jgi:hypothetical protein